MCVVKSDSRARVAPGRGRRPDVHRRERELDLDVIPIAVSTAGSIVYKELKSDSRHSRKPYSLHIKHSHTQTYAQYHTTAYQPLSSPRASPATSTTSTANICDSILTGSLDWAIYSADQHSTYLALKPRIWQLQQYSLP
jgi:hypothetical protein